MKREAQRATPPANPTGKELIRLRKAFAAQALVVQHLAERTATVTAERERQVARAKVGAVALGLGCFLAGVCAAVSAMSVSGGTP